MKRGPDRLFGAARAVNPLKYQPSQRQFAGDPVRRQLIGKVHIARKDLGIEEDDYRAILFRLTQHSSAKDCSTAELVAVVEEFKRKGWKPAQPKGRKPADARPADHPSAKKARALWISLHHLGAIKNPSDQALEAFACGQLKCERLQWADQGKTDSLIEALKAMAEREGWDQSLKGVKPEARILVLKRRLVDAIFDKLVKVGLVPDDWTIARAAKTFAGIELDGSMLLWSLGDLDRVAKVLGMTLRQPVRPVTAEEIQR